MIELRTFGGIDLRSVDGEVASSVAIQPKRLALLAYLALGSSSGYRRRDSVVGHLWPELDSLHARGALRQALHSIRRSLGQDVVTARGEEEIGVNHDTLWCDAVVFKNRIATSAYEEALELYRGDFLDGFFASDVGAEFEQWIGDTRLDLRRAAARAAWEIADRSRADGQINIATSFARRAAGLAVEDENGIARLISFLDGVGDRAGALDAYDEFATRLKKEYDAEPSPETQALIRRVRKRTIASEQHIPEAETIASNLRVDSSDVSRSVNFRATRENESAAVGAAGRKGSRWDRYSAVTAVLLVAVVVGAIAKLGPGAAKAPYSVAVLPLQDLSGDTSRAYIAEGVTDQLITDLAQLGTLQVINRRTMMTYRNSRKTPRDIAKDLHADAVVAGTIQTLGETVRMTTQLVFARDDRTAWAQTFEGTRGELLRMQREAARVAARQIRGALTPAGEATLPRVRSMDPEALDLYIKGRYYWNKRGPGLLKSIGMFTQALDLDPTFALAYSGMADAYVQLGYGNGLAPRDAFPKARAAAIRAIELDSTIAEPHAALAFVHLYYDWDWPRADKEFRRAIALNPSYATAHEWYGLYLTAMERSAEAKKEEARAEELDPLSVPIAGTAAWVQFYTGDLMAAKQGIRIALRGDSTFGLGHLYLGRMYQEGKQLDSALLHYDLTGPLREWVPTLAGKGYVFGATGRKVEARAMLARLDSMSRKGYVTAYGVALVHASLGQRDSAFAWLDRGVEERTNWMVWLKLDHRWDPIRSDPRFAALTRKVGLPK